MSPATTCEAQAELFKTLGHPVRVRVLELLVEGPLSVRELRSSIGVQASRLSQQLAVLRHSGIIIAVREKGTVTYALGAGQIAQLLAVSRQILAEMLASRLEAVGELVPLDRGG